MELEIGDKKYKVPKIKAGKMLAMARLQDEASESGKLAKGFELTIRFYVDMLSPDHPEITMKYLEENMDSYMLGIVFFTKVARELLSEPKNASEPKAAVKK